jgi:hypothetical protein
MSYPQRTGLATLLVLHNYELMSRPHDSCVRVCWAVARHVGSCVRLEVWSPVTPNKEKAKAQYDAFRPLPAVPWSDAKIKFKMINVTCECRANQSKFSNSMSATVRNLRFSRRRLPIIPPIIGLRHRHVARLRQEIERGLALALAEASAADRAREAESPGR